MKIEGTKVVIIDDHTLFSKGLASILSNLGLRVMCIFNDGKEAIPYLLSTQVDIVLCDINMPKVDGLQLCKTITKQSKTKIIILSMYEDKNIIKEAFKCGASGYLSKNSSQKEIITTITKVLSGKIYVNKKLLKITSDNNNNNNNNNPDKYTLKYTLTERERMVMKCIIEEKNNTEIGVELGISKRTVETHRKNILVKLGVNNTVALTKLVIKHNLV
jgi:DNA-binding NarL/FixJ family response regulator